MSEPISVAIANQLDETDRDLVLRFFVLFSRFEYALKRSPGFLRGRDRAEPDWRAFKRSIRDRLNAVADPATAAAVQYLLQNPPHQQMVVEGALTWVRPQLQSDFLERRLVEHVKTVRNNLFHGGKFPAAPVSEAARDRALLSATITVLEALATLEYEVGRAIREPLEVALQPA